MGDENKIRDAADAIKGIVEAVPVYQDVVQPAAQEIGKGLQTVAKVIHIALAPVSGIVWGYDRIKEYLQETLSKKLNNVPPEEIVPPKLTIAGPLVEQLRFAADEPSLRELYANLLASAMDAKTTDKAHPAFVEIIRQLTPDEAKLLSYMWKAIPRLFPLLSGRMPIKGDGEVEGFTYIYKFKQINFLALKAALANPMLIPSYIDNLLRLRLLKVEPTIPNQMPFHLGFREEEWEAIRRAKESFANYFKSFGRESPRPVFQSHQKELINEFLQFTKFGEQFCITCLEEDRRLKTQEPKDTDFETHVK